MLWWIFGYLLLSLGIPAITVRYTQNIADFYSAERKLSAFHIAALITISWFGPNTLFGVPNQFLEHGITGIYADPVGTSACLLLIAACIGKKLYSQPSHSLGDIYTAAYTPNISRIISLFIAMTYIGYLITLYAAITMLIPMLIPSLTGCLFINSMITALIAFLYIAVGGSRAMADSNSLQTVILLTILLITTVWVSSLAGGFQSIIHEAYTTNKLNPMPHSGWNHRLTYISALIILMLGSLPQQDIYQKVTSARSEKDMVYGFILGAVGHFITSIMPLFVIYAMSLIPSVILTFPEHISDSELINHLITCILPKPLAAIFLGSILITFLCAAAHAICAATVLIDKNILYHGTWRNKISPLTFARGTMLTVSISSAIFMILSTKSIYDTVLLTYELSLVSALIPLLFALYCSKPSTTGAMWSITMGITIWLMVKIWPIPAIPTSFIGVGFGVLGMLCGSMYEYIKNRGSLPYKNKLLQPK